jgi:diguanylate cyclase (GGDEF)-like protein
VGNADVAQLVAHHLAKVRVAGSNPVVRSTVVRSTSSSPGRETADYQDMVGGWRSLVLDAVVPVVAVLIAWHLLGRRFEKAAAHDVLTGLPNRALLSAALGKAGDDAALLMIDLDGFKAVNDTQGHLAGDRLLVTFADRLRDAVAPFGAHATAARLGGDEFAVLVRRAGCDERRDLATTIVGVAAEPVVVDGRIARVRASIGIARHAPGRLLHEADLALYEAKRRGKGRFQIFDASLSAAVEEQRRLQAELGGALAAGEFEVVYQPVADLPSGNRIGVEALVRWHHPRHGVLDREAFEAAAAECGLLPEIEGWMLRTALAQQSGWRTVQPRFALFIELSAPYLRADTMAADIGRLEPGAMLAIRISDTSHLTELIPAIKKLRELGALVALDGFGTGRSPLIQLRDLPISAIKLDRELLRDLDRNPEALALLGAVVALVDSVGLDCVAGGVERPEQAEQLRRLGCRRAVGPRFGTATPASEVILRPEISYA